MGATTSYRQKQRGGIRWLRMMLVTVLVALLALSTAALLVWPRTALAEGADAVSPSAPDAAAVPQSQTAGFLQSPSVKIGRLTDGELDRCYVKLRPHGFLCTANVNHDGLAIGNACILYNLGTSSKLYLTCASGEGAGYYYIQSMIDFIETDVTNYNLWDVDGQSKKDGAVVHVWKDKGDKNFSRQWAFERNADGTYYVINHNSGKYLSLENPSKDANDNKLVQSSTPMAWDLEIIVNETGRDVAAYSTYGRAVDWMAALPDSTLITDISLPGTHDSGTCRTFGDIEPQSSFTACQQYYIDEQLAAGVRFLDVRLGMDGLADKDPYVNHGGTICLQRSGAELRLSHVLADVDRFLRQHPSETVVLMFSKSGSAGDEKNMLASLYEAATVDYPERVYLGADTVVPSLGHVRGKMVFAHRIDAKTLAPEGLNEHSYGLNLHMWGDYNDAYASTKDTVKIRDASQIQAWVQDNYGTTADSKIAYVEGALASAPSRQSGAEAAREHAWVLNYTSCTKNNPFTAARNMKQRLYTSEILAGGNQRFLGVVMMDFVDAQMCWNVYRHNFSGATLTAAAPFALPESVTLTYGQSLVQGRLTGGKVLGDGFLQLAAEGERLSVADSGMKRLRYVNVQPDGAMSPTTLEGEVLVKVEPRVVTCRWEAPARLGPSSNLAAELTGTLVYEGGEGVLEDDECMPALAFFCDDHGALGQPIVLDAQGMLPAGTYWVQAQGLEGADAANYQLTASEPMKFVVEEAGAGASEGSGNPDDGEDAESPDDGESSESTGGDGDGREQANTRSSDNEKSASKASDTKLSQTGDPASAAVWCVAAIGATLVALIARKRLSRCR